MSRNRAINHTTISVGYPSTVPTPTTAASDVLAECVFYFWDRQTQHITRKRLIAFYHYRDTDKPRGSYFASD